MFKNIEISVINQSAVMNSLLITGIAIGIGALTGLVYSFGITGIGLLFMAIVYGIIGWGIMAFAILGIEKLFLGKRATEKRVAIVFGVETLVPATLSLGRIDEPYPEVRISIILGLITGQIVRWAYLYYSGKMFNSVKHD